MKLSKLIRTVPDFPKPGVNFLDFSPLLASPKDFAADIEWHADQIPAEVDAIVGVESRGFILAAALAQRLAKPLVMARKGGKLPGECVSGRCDIEYAQGLVFEMGLESLKPFKSFWVIDDVLATGGTAIAIGDMLKGVGKQSLGFGFLIEIEFLKGRSVLAQKFSDAQCVSRYQT